MLKAVEHVFSGTTTPYTAYDSTKTTLGKWMVQNTGVNTTDKWAGPFTIKTVKLVDETTFGYSSQSIIDWGNNTHWVFLGETSTASTTRKISLFTFDTSSFMWSYRGFITLTYPSGTNHTIRSLKVAKHLHTTGTVSSSGTAVTGSGSDWSTARIAAGARIGFGSTDPTQITTWYYISSIASDTSLTLSTTPPVAISAGSSYVIEELRVYTANTASTTTNGGLFVAKGINFDDFATGGTTIAAATSTDNLKAVYWLADASTVTNTITAGMDFGGTSATNTNHDIYVFNADSTSAMRIFKYNGRASLSGLSSGKSTSSFVFKTAAQTVTASINQSNNGCVATASHGPGSGISCLYFTSTTRVYRARETNVRDSVNFIDDNMVEIPLGGANTFVPTANMAAISYFPSIDKFCICYGGSTNSSFNYLTSYQTTSDKFETFFGVATYATGSSLGDSEMPQFINCGLVPNIVMNSFAKEISGIMYYSRYSTNTSNSQLYALPVSDWNNPSLANRRLFTPEIYLTNCLSVNKIFVNCSNYLGYEKWSLPTEPYKLYYRTSGISDNTGSWVQVKSTGDLSDLKNISSIQFMFEFKIFGTTCIPARIHSLTVTYNDFSINSNYQFSLSKSNIVNKRFAWRFSAAYGGTVPNLTVYLYDNLGNLIVTDTTTSSSYGLWEKSTNGGSSWSSYDASDKANETTYIRYTPTTLADNIKIKAYLV